MCAVVHLLARSSTRFLFRTVDYLQPPPDPNYSAPMLCIDLMIPSLRPLHHWNGGSPHHAAVPGCAHSWPHCRIHVDATACRVICSAGHSPIPLQSWTLPSSSPNPPTSRRHRSASIRRRSRLFWGFSSRTVLSARMPDLNLDFLMRVGATKACPSSCACTQQTDVQKRS